MIAAVAVVGLLAAGTIVFTATRRPTPTHHPAGLPTATSGASGTTSAATSRPSARRTTDFATLYAHEQSGVVRIETLGCSESGVGTGFLISPTLVATVNHVIEQSVVISLIAGDQRTTGTVIGADANRDLALVQAAHPFHGYNFKFASSPPDVGDQVATIGFPIGGPITLTQGSISGLDRNVNFDGLSLTGLVQTDTLINPGNSGGPLIDQRGQVVGLIDGANPDAVGIGYAIAADQATAMISAWRLAPHVVPPATCPEPIGPTQVPPVIVPPPPGQITDSQLAGIIDAFTTYFEGINTGNYSAAWAVLSPRLQGGVSSDAFAEEVSTSYDFGQTILEAHAIDATTVHVALAFTSLQTAEKGPDGETCTNWTLLYTMIQASDGRWLIDGTQPYHGVEHAPC